MYHKYLGVFATFIAVIVLPFAAAAQCTTSATNTGPYCPDATISLFAGSGGISYAWSGPAGFIDANVNPNISLAQVSNSGVYTVTVTFAGGCTASSTTRVTVNPRPGAIASAPPPTTFCSGTLLALSATGGGVGGRYLWNGPNAFTSALQNPSIANVPSTGSGTYNVTVTNTFGCTNIAALSVVINDPPAVTITQTGTSCAGNTITLTGSAPGAVSYNWSGVNSTTGSTPDITLTGISANTNGSYFVSITDLNNCVGTASTLVSVTTINGTVANTLPVCEGGTVQFGASGGATYAWAGPLAFVTNGNAPFIASATPANSGNYTVTITDANGCAIVQNTFATINPNPTVSISVTNAKCYISNDGTMLGVGAAGTPSYTYKWSNGPMVDNIIGLSVGTYSVTVSDINSCTATASASITEPTPLSADVVQIQNATCANSNNGGATASVTGGTPLPNGTYNYAWNNGVTTFKVTNIPCGQGNVIISDANGCNLQKFFNILCPALLQLSDSVGTSVNCKGGSDGRVQVNIVGGIQPYIYDWVGLPLEITNTIIGYPKGTYTVNITDANGCTAGPFPVFVSEPALPMSITMSGTAAICKDGASGTANAVALGGTTPYNYRWEPTPAVGTQSQTAVNLPINTYTTTVTDNRGCSIIGQFTVTEPPYVVVTASSNPTTCYGDDNGNIIASPATGGNGGPFMYSLDNANYQDDVIFQSLPASLYTVYATDVKGCTATTTVRITQPDPIQLSVTNGANVVVEMGNSVQIVTNTNVLNPGALQYIWSPIKNLSCGNCPNPIANPLSPQQYSVTVTDAAGCTARADVQIDVQKNRNIYIPNIFTPNNDSNNDEFVIYGGLGVVRIKDLKIFDRWGEMVFAAANFQPNDRSFGWDGRFKGEIMRTGVFIYVMEVEFVDNLLIPYKGDVTLVR